jgi:hypothetical protein
MAGEDECVACCRAAGLSGCRSSLRMYGDGSVATAEAGAWRVLGLWFLDCGGQGRFEAGSTAVLPAMPVAGELLLATTPGEAFHCFTQACSYPENACFEHMTEGRVRMVDCRDGAPMPASQLAQPGPIPPGSESIIAVVGSRPLVVTPVEAARAPYPAAPGSSGSCCGGGAGLFGHGQPAERAIVTQSYDDPGLPLDLSTSPPSMGDGDYARVSGSLDAYVLDIPEPPLSPECGTAEVLRTESRRRVDAGNEAMVRGDLQASIDEYRAALTLDPCNPYAWADLGALALRLEHPAEAALALSQAVELQPRHYTAYTNLGLAYELLAQPGLARDAFRVALGLRPHHQPALQGLARVEGQP